MSLATGSLQVFHAHGQLDSGAMHLLEGETTLCNIPASAGIVIANPQSEHEHIWSVSHKQSQCAGCAWHYRNKQPKHEKPSYPGSESWETFTTRIRVTSMHGTQEGLFFGFQQRGEAGEWHLGIDDGENVGMIPASEVINAVAV